MHNVNCGFKYLAKKERTTSRVPQLIFLLNISGEETSAVIKK